MDDKKELTLEDLIEMHHGAIIATGEIENSQKGLFMVGSNIGKMLVWAAIRGGGLCDWAIYTHWAEKGLDFAITQGDKVTSKENIQKLVPCTVGALSHYRL